jgi:hypothetical protein
VGGVYLFKLMNGKKATTRSSRTTPNLQERMIRGWSFAYPHTLIVRYLLILALTATLFSACRSSNPAGDVGSKTLTTDERYIVELYMRIIETEKNLQDNPEEMEKKWSEIRQEYDEERVLRIYRELEKNPERWLVVYSRIIELLKRRESASSS